MARNRKGQFIIIAAILISIMIVSVSTVIYGTVTYYRQERWEEYVTIVDSIKAASCNLLQVGLANYTQSQTLNPNVMRDYFNRWIRDVRSAYPAFGIDVGYALANRAYSAYGFNNINYNLGLASLWNQSTSYSASNATISIDVASVGLTGYNFSSHVFLKMSIRDAWIASGNYFMNVTVQSEGPKPVAGLTAANFFVRLNGGSPQPFTVRYYYGRKYSYFTYEIKVSSISSLPLSTEIRLRDSRGVETVSTWPA